MENGIGTMLQPLKETKSQKQMSGSLEHPVKVSVLQEKDKDSKESLDSFLKSFESSKRQKKIDPTGLSTKMLKECLVVTKDLTTLPFSLKWNHSGMISNGSFLTAPIMSHKTGRGSILLDILEKPGDIPQKYFLSKEQTEKIVFVEPTSSGTEKTIEETSKSLVPMESQKPLTPLAGGGRGHHTIEVIGKAYERDNYGDNRNRILGTGGVSPSMTATQYKEPYRVGQSLSEILALQKWG